MLQNKPIDGTMIASKVCNGLFLLYYGWYFLQGAGLFFQNIHLLPESFIHGDIVEILITSLMSLHSVGLYALFIIAFFMLVSREKKANHVAAIYLLWKVAGLFVYPLPFLLSEGVRSFLSILAKPIIIELLIDGAFLFFYLRRIANAKRSGDENSRRMLRHF